MLVTIDAECTLHETSHPKRFASSPHSPKNSVVLLGTLRADEEKVTLHDFTDKYAYKSLKNLINRTIAKHGKIILAGHNIKYDILYLYKHTQLRNAILDAFRRNELMLWDTQVVEYLLSGQQDKFITLDKLSEKYGYGLFKDDKVKEYWERGISTELIPQEILKPYLKEDVRITHNIATKQISLAKKKGMIPLIITQMEAEMALIECEYNGMAYDVPKAISLERVLSKELDELDVRIAASTKDALRARGLPDSSINTLMNNRLWNIHSPQQLQAVIYGGYIRTETEITDGVYKSGKKKGQPKKKIDRLTIRIADYTNVLRIVGNQGKQTSEATLNKIISKLDEHDPVRKLLNFELQYRAKKKLLSTYIKPALDYLVWDHDTRIHHTLNQAQTVTGRLSSSNPNLQNIPKESKGGVKDLFIAEPGYSIVEIDYSQLEVVCAAYISQDKQLIEDIRNGVDMHLENASTLFRKPKSKITSRERTAAKIATFQLQYGAGIATIAEAAFGGNKKLAKDFVLAYEKRYPDLAKYFRDLYNTIERRQEPCDPTEVTPRGNIRRQTVYATQTGRRLVFKTYDAPSWNKSLTSFSPTEIKNYPIQSLATGDIVPMMLGKVFKNAVLTQIMHTGYNNPLVKLVNTVHDSILLEVHETLLPVMIKAVQRELNKVYEYLKEYFDIDFNVPLEVDIQYGTSWGALKAWKPKK